MLGDEIAARIPTDYFLVPRPPDLSLVDFLKQPLRYDWDLLRSLLRQPVGTPVETPDADFGNFTRISDVGGRPFTIRPVMITDAMAGCPDADLLILLDAPSTVRYDRIAARDVRWGTNVLANWKHLEMTWHASRLKLPAPDLILDGNRPLPRNADTLASLVRTYLAKAKPSDNLA